MPLALAHSIWSGQLTNGRLPKLNHSGQPVWRKTLPCRAAGCRALGAVHRPGDQRCDVLSCVVLCCVVLCSALPDSCAPQCCVVLCSAVGTSCRCRWSLGHRRCFLFPPRGLGSQARAWTARNSTWRAPDTNPGSPKTKRKHLQSYWQLPNCNPFPVRLRRNQVSG